MVSNVCKYNSLKSNFLFGRHMPSNSGDGFLLRCAISCKANIFYFQLNRTDLPYFLRKWSENKSEDYQFYFYFQPFSYFFQYALVKSSSTVSELALGAGCGFNSQPGQTKDIKIGICRFYTITQHLGIRTGWSAQSQNKMSG